MITWVYFPKAFTYLGVFWENEDEGFAAYNLATRDSRTPGFSGPSSPRPSHSCSVPWENQLPLLSSLNLTHKGKCYQSISEGLCVKSLLEKVCIFLRGLLSVRDQECILNKCLLNFESSLTFCELSQQESSGLTLTKGATQKAMTMTHDRKLQ